jgi:hypothetical protein
LGKHARPAPHRPAVLAVLTGAAAAGAAALVPAASAPLAAPEPAVPARAQLDAAVQRVPATWAVRSGDTLYGIAGRFCGDGYDYPSLAAASGIRDADAIIPGEVIRLACHGAAAGLSGSQPPAGAVVTSAEGYFSCSALEALWEEAGGAQGEAFMAAEIAQAESGGRAGAISPTDDWGLWQVNEPAHPAQATLDPLGNARAAVAISDDGTDWAPWTTYETGAYGGKC